MKVVQTEIPESLYRQIEEMARREQIPVERLVLLFVAHGLGSWQAQDQISERAKRGSREKFRDVMSSVPDVEPDEQDKLP